MFNDNLANQPGMFPSKLIGGKKTKNTRRRQQTGKRTKNKNNGKTKKNTNKKTKKMKKTCNVCGKMKGLFRFF
jgi:ribosomal protein S14